MTIEKFERAQEIKQEMESTLDFSWLIKNYQSSEEESARIVYETRDGKINTSDPSSELCRRLIDTVNAYYTELQTEFKNL